jgi:hypothetical protein
VHAKAAGIMAAFEETSVEDASVASSTFAG